MPQQIDARDVTSTVDGSPRVPPGGRADRLSAVRYGDDGGPPKARADRENLAPLAQRDPCGTGVADLLGVQGLGDLVEVGVRLYFSLVTYTTIGFGDVVVGPGWRMLAGIEGLTGILLVGWSTAFVFAVVSRMYVGVRQETRRAQIRDLRRW